MESTSFSGVKRVEVEGLHRRLDVALDFAPDVNVIYGRNGTGKTTILHILANVLNGSIERFVFLSFTRIRIITNEGRRIEIIRQKARNQVGSQIYVHLDGRRIGPPLNVLEVRRELLRRPDRQSEIGGSLSKFREAMADLPVGPVTYFPAFRTMIEAWWTKRETEAFRDSPSYASRLEAEFYQLRLLEDRMESERRRPSQATLLARNLFGDFVPSINYPSPIEIQYDLARRVQDATYMVAARSRDILSRAFINAFAALSQGNDITDDPPEKILNEINGALERLGDSKADEDYEDLAPEDVYAQLRTIAGSVRTNELTEAAANVLAVYRESLFERLQVQKRAFEPVEQYVTSVNEFLEGKKLIIERSSRRTPDRSVNILFRDGSRVNLRSLSSGERQIVSMLYAATGANLGNVVLVDEPEISLHIDWQRMLLERMTRQMGRRQIIVCTHSPEIGADFESRYQELMPIFHSKQRYEAGDSNSEGNDFEIDFDGVPF